MCIKPRFVIIYSIFIDGIFTFFSLVHCLPRICKFFKLQAKDDVQRGLSFGQSNYNSDNGYTKAMDALQRNVSVCNSGERTEWQEIYKQSF